MSEVTDSRYSLDYDAEFTDMLTQIKMLKSQSSLIEDDFEIVDSGFSQSPEVVSLLDTPSPVNNKNTEDVENRKQKNSQGKRSSVNSLRIEDISIELSDDDENAATADSDESDADVAEANFDLNATYSARTMGNRRLSLWLDILKDLEEENEEEEDGLEQEEVGLEQNMNQLLCIETDRRTPHKNIQGEVTPSPKTPCNSVELIPDRSYRLRNINETPSVFKKSSI